MYLISIQRHCHRLEEGMMTTTYAITSILISVVDDDASVRKTTKLLIESFGYRAVVFDSAETFLKSGQLNDTSCLVVDVQMPGMNGLQLQSHLASEGCSIPIIFISAYGNKESRRQAMQGGAIAFLDKPFRDEKLLQNIRLALKQAEDSDEDNLTIRVSEMNTPARQKADDNG